MNDDGNSNNTILPIQYGGIVLMCGLQNRDKNEETHTYKSNHNRGVRRYNYKID